MPNWRRAHVPGGSFFFTLVTEERCKLFLSAKARKFLGDVFREMAKRRPLRVDALVLMPDHLHAMWTLPQGDANYPTRWAWTKKEFTKRWLASGGREVHVSAGKKNDGRRGVWQVKYREHTLQDEDDYERHFDYIHFNPVKHGYVSEPRQWKWSTFHRWVQAGVYSERWACGPLPQTLQEFDFSETTGE